MSKLYRPLPDNVAAGFRLAFQDHVIRPTVYGGLVAHPRRGVKIDCECCFIELGPDGIAIGHTPSMSNYEHYQPELVVSHILCIQSVITELSLLKKKKLNEVHINKFIIRHGRGYDYRQTVVQKYVTNLTPNDSVETWAEEISNIHPLRGAYRFYERWVIQDNLDGLEWEDDRWTVPTTWPDTIKVDASHLSAIGEFADVFKQSDFAFVRGRDQCWLGGTINMDAERFDQFVRGSGWLVEHDNARPEYWSVLHPENIKKIAQMPAIALAHYLRLIYFVDERYDGFIQKVFKAGVLSAIAGRARQLCQGATSSGDTWAR